MRPDGALDTSLEDESRQISKRAHSATKSKPAAKAKHHRATRYYGHRRFAFRFFFRGYRRQRDECQLLALFGHPTRTDECPLLGVKRTWRGLISMSAYDPKRTFAATPVMKAYAWEAPSAAIAYQQTWAPEVQT